MISSVGSLVRFREVRRLHRLYGVELAYLLEKYALAAETTNLISCFLGARRIAGRMLRSTPIMSLAVKVLGRVDNQPGRLNSFVADRRET